MKSYEDINTAFLDCLRDLYFFKERRRIKGNNVKEAIDYSFEIKNPIRRVLTCPYRYNNISATVAETLWVFAGRHDMRFLKYFLHNCLNYSDDGETWRGAYGPRIIGSQHFSKFNNQIENVVMSLKNDPSSRQAVIVIGQPFDYDWDLETKDRPCTVYVQFLIRDDKLHCITNIRSNDIMWGCFNINIFEWTFLQEIIAGILNVSIGSYIHHAGSFHLYEEMFKRADNILLCLNKYNVYNSEMYADTGSVIGFYNVENFVLFAKKCTEFLEEMMWRTDTYHSFFMSKFYELRSWLETSKASFSALKYLLVPAIFITCIKRDISSTTNLMAILDRYSGKDLTVATAEYVARYFRKISEDPEFPIVERLKEEIDLDDKSWNFIGGKW